MPIHDCPQPGRRRFLSAVGALGASVGFAPMAAALQSPRKLAFAHTHTGEELAVTYWRDGTYAPEALVAINRLLRDFRTNEVHAVAPALLDYLYQVQCMLDREAPFEVISGFRSAATNDMLQRRTSGVATWSLHMEGRAIDVRVPGVPTARLREAALRLRLGGVGYYPSSGFVHLDTGRVRQW